MKRLALIVGLLTAASAHAQMTLPGKFEVTDTGSASYTIPISIVPGTAGLEPKLSLQYDSRSGNGLLGVGWSLAGLPAITRCGKTIAQDGAVGGVAYDANDRFCLDGQRLIAISGTYGADLTEYRTERESFSKVVSYGTVSGGSGPSWFKVWTKAGLVMEFGNTADSKIEAQGKASVRVWALNRTSDTKANFFAVSYTEDNASSEYRPLCIYYNGSSCAAPANSVRFVYETRTDIAPLYQAGGLIKTTQRMTKVQAWQGANMVREYRLAYLQSAASGRSQLTTIKLCEEQEPCLSEIANAYLPGVAAPGFSLTLNPVTPSEVNNNQIYAGDWNGDGITDVLTYHLTSGNTRWLMSNAASADGPSFSYHLNPDPVAPNLINNNQIYMGDWNGDGITDLLAYHASSGYTRWFISNGSTGGAPSFTYYLNPAALLPTDINNNQIHVGDWNGDGLLDLLVFHPTGGHNRWYINTGMGASGPNFSLTLNPISSGDINNNQLHIGDWNGDGLPDLLAFNPTSGYNRWYINQGIGVSGLGFNLSLNPIASGDINNNQIYVGDWNGDGLSDLLAFNPTSGYNRWYINKGIGVSGLGFNLTLNPIASGDINSNQIYVGDWNGDGLSDLLTFHPAGGHNRWYTNTGTGGGGPGFSLALNPIAITDINNNQLHFGDWNGDGILDVLAYHVTGGTTRWYTQAGIRQDFLKTVQGGTGNHTTATLRPLPRGTGLYSKDAGTAACAYPCLDVQGPLYVVSEVKSSNGLGITGAGGEYRSTYRYAGAKADSHGRGFLGFRQMTVKDEQTGVEQVTTYRQDYPFTGLVATREKKLGTQLLNRSSNSYGSSALGGTRRYPFLTASLEESWELTGDAALPAVTTAYQYDAYGNATQVGVSTGDGHAKTTINTYSNDNTNWLLGRLTRSEVTSTTP
jgi:hypothetical protein